MDNMTIEQAKSLQDMLSERAVSVLDSTLEFAKQAGNFASEQTPIVIKEFLYWSAAENIIWMIVLSISAIALSKAFKWASKGFHSSNCSGDEEGYVLVMVLSGAGFIGTMGINTVFILDLVKIIVAPRLYLLTGLADLVKEVR